MKEKNRDESLETLYDIVVQELTRRIKMGEATASDLSVARQLLKDANIDSNIGNKDSPLIDLLDNLPFRAEEG